MGKAGNGTRSAKGKSTRRTARKAVPSPESAFNGMEHDVPVTVERAWERAD